MVVLASSAALFCWNFSTVIILLSTYYSGLLENVRLSKQVHSNCDALHKDKENDTGLNRMVL